MQQRMTGSLKLDDESLRSLVLLHGLREKDIPCKDLAGPPCLYSNVRPRGPDSVRARDSIRLVALMPCFSMIDSS